MTEYELETLVELMEKICSKCPYKNACEYEKYGCLTGEIYDKNK